MEDAWGWGATVPFPCPCWYAVILERKKPTPLPGPTKRGDSKLEAVHCSSPNRSSAEPRCDSAEVAGRPTADSSRRSFSCSSRTSLHYVSIGSLTAFPFQRKMRDIRSGVIPWGSGIDDDTWNVSLDAPEARREFPTTL